MQIKIFTLFLFAAGVATEASIDFEPAFQVTRQRVGNQQEYEREHQRQILLAAQARQANGYSAHVLPVARTIAPIESNLLVLSNARHRALAV